MDKFAFKIPGVYFDPFLFIIFVILPIVAALLCLYNAFRFLKRARTLEDTPLSKLRAAAQGYIEVEGIIAPLFMPVLGALSKLPCVWYRYQIYDHTNNETPILQGISTTPFLLNEDGSPLIILPNAADIITAQRLSWYGNSLTEISYPKPSLWTKLFGTHGRYCYIEERLELNTKVYATGMFYTWQAKCEEIEQNPFLKEYQDQYQKSSLNVLTNLGIGQKQSLLVSTKMERNVAREYRFKALIFFLAFLFFSILLVTSNYPMVMKTFESL